MRPPDDQGANDLHETFRRIARCIPEGRVATYGQIAALAERPRNARQVGHALARLADDSVPWHRVVNARGEVSQRGIDPLDSVDRQRFLLEEEGVVFDLRGRIDLDRFGWDAMTAPNSAALPAPEPAPERRRIIERSNIRENSGNSVTFQKEKHCK